MNVTLEKVGNVNGYITVSIEANDYQDKVKKELKTIGLRHPERGFRPGHVPMALLQKKYGREALVETINREAYDALVKYIQDNKLNILGDPMIANAADLVWENGKDFNLKFEVGIAPEINYTVGKDTTVPYYNIEVSDEMLKKNDEMLLARAGKQVPGEVVDDTALVKGSMVELAEDGSVKEGGLSVENTIVSPQHFKADDQKALFAGKKVGDEVVFNPWATCDGSAVELASMLNTDKDKVAELKSNFKMTIKEILVVKKAEHGQEFYDEMFGTGKITSEEEYFAKLKENIANQMKGDSNYRFTIDARKAIMDKVGALELPADFLKRWLLRQDDKKHTPETIDADFEKMTPDLQWQLVKEKLVADLAVKVEEADFLNIAKLIAVQQFAQYGMTNIPDDVVERYAKEILDNKEYRQRIAERAVEDKMYAGIKEAVNIEEKTVSVDDFNALFKAEEETAAE